MEVQKNIIYLDNNATTQPDPRVVAEYCRVAGDADLYGNPSSVHGWGRRAKELLNRSRRVVADYFSVPSHRIFFTSGGTEGINLVLRGLEKKGHIITTDLEHAAVYRGMKFLEGQGYTVTYLSGGALGAVTPKQVQEALRSDTVLVAVMAVNNETGVKSDWEGIAEVAEEAGVSLFVDGVALMGKEEFVMPKGVSAMSFSGHKFHGLKSSGFLYLREDFRVKPLLLGGGQEYGKRSGTEDIAGTCALAKAVELLREELPQGVERMRLLRDHFEEEVGRKVPGVVVNGEGPRVSNVSNVAFEDGDAETLLMALDRKGIAVGYGSACASGTVGPSRVLLNMGYEKERAMASLRFSLSRMTTEEEIDTVVEVLCLLLQS